VISTYFAIGAHDSLQFLCCQFNFTAAIFNHRFSICLERSPEALVSMVDFLFNCRCPRSWFSTILVQFAASSYLCEEAGIVLEPRDQRLELSGSSFD
jgi:hypothetical protein